MVVVVADPGGGGVVDECGLVEGEYVVGVRVFHVGVCGVEEDEAFVVVVAIGEYGDGVECGAVGEYVLCESLSVGVECYGGE